MDLSEVIQNLRDEKTRLNEVITVLERLRSLDVNCGAPKRRGRKYMDNEARLEVSLRMKNYWAAKKKSALPRVMNASAEEPEALATHAAAA